MTAWWTSLSWSHAALVVIAVLLILALLASLIGKCMSINEPPAPRSYHVVDYSAAYQRQRDWLGDRYLLKNPINRRVAR